MVDGEPPFGQFGPSETTAVHRDRNPSPAVTLANRFVIATTRPCRRIIDARPRFRRYAPTWGPRASWAGTPVPHQGVGAAFGHEDATQGAVAVLCGDGGQSGSRAITGLQAGLEASSVIPRLTSAHPPRGVGQPLGAPDDHGAAFTQRELGGFPNAPRRRGQSIHPAGLAGSLPQAMTGSVLSTVLSRHRVRERRVRRSNCWGAIADRGFLRFLAGNLCTRQLAAACVWFLTGARTG